MTTIPWRHRMAVRVSAGVCVLVGISIGAALVVATRVATDRSLARASEDMQTAQASFYRLVDTRGESASAETRLITALPVFRAHIPDVRLASDRGTMEEMTDEYRRQLRAEFALVTDRTGAWIASPGWPGNEAAPPALLRGIEAARTGHHQRDLVVVRGALFVVVFEPAQFADEVLGTLIAGFALDDAVAADLAGLAHVEVSVITDNRLSASSLQSASRGELTRLLAHPPLRNLRGVSPGLTPVGDRRFVAGAFSLFRDRPSDELGRLVLLQDWQPTQQFLDELLRKLLGGGLVIVACALGGALAFSRRMTRPFEEIATAAGDVAGGNWTRHVELRGKGEARVMAAAFNEMSASLRHWSDEAHDKSRRLQAAYERFHSVTESARDAIVSTDGQGTITFWNRSAAAIFRCPEEQALGQPFTRFMAGSDRAFFDAAVEPLLAGGAGPGTGGVIDISANGLDGEPFPAEIALSVSTSEGRPAIIAVVRDITERKRAEAVLEQRNEELRQAQKMEALGRLAGGVAHDFNNLLTAMRGYGEILKDALTGDEKRSGYAAQILRAADSAAALTRQLLAVSRRQKLAPETLALDRIVRSMEQILRRVIGEDVTLASASEPSLGLVRADPGQIEQVLMNLAVNARDAMPGGGQIHITLSNVVVDESAGRAHDGLAAGAYVQLAVVDTGCGMDEDTARHIFEPFFTTKGVGQGTGLGLSTVYGIVQQSGGRVEVDTAPGQGTTFRVLLPCVDAEETTVEAPPIAKRAGAASETVLLVEDDARVRGFVSNVLERQGYRVLEADGAPAALDVLSQHPAAIHLLLTDVVMPGMNGRELAERVTGVRPSTRVLFMSGYSNDAVLLRGVSAHDGHFVQKPFTIDVLSTKIREAMASP